MNSGKLFALAAAFALTLAGCGGSTPLPTTGEAGIGGFSSGSDFGNGANTTGLDSGGGQGFLSFPGATAAEIEQLRNLIVYFEFDSSEIRSDFNAMLAAHGRYLSANPNATVRLEGHADERGSREYNIGLGERRALAVRQILLLQGASPSQLSTVSYGEERPAVFGSDEESYSLNRRVELVYR